MTMVFEVVLFNGATLAMGAFGIASIAAHQIAITIPSLTFMVPLGIGMAATVRVGLAAGAGDAVAARRAGFTAIAMGAVFMSVTAMLLLLFPARHRHAWLPDMPANRDVLALAVTFLHVAAAFQIVDGMQVTAAMSLRGLKDARMADVAGGRLLLAGGCADVRCCWVSAWACKGLGIWLGLAFGLLWRRSAHHPLCAAVKTPRSVKQQRHRDHRQQRDQREPAAAGCGGPVRGRSGGRYRDAASRRLPPPSGTILRHS